MLSSLDIAANRRATKWSAREMVLRVVWACVQPAFRFSPRLLWGWRRFLLRAFGATIGRGVHVHPSVRVTIPWNLQVGDLTSIGDDVRVYALGMIVIGRRVTVSQGVHLCAGTHDFRSRQFPLVKSPISIGDDAWICADAFIGPGVRVGALAIVGARGVVVRDIGASSVVAGNPAVQISRRSAPT